MLADLPEPVLRLVLEALVDAHARDRPREPAPRGGSGGIGRHHGDHGDSDSDSDDDDDEEEEDVEDDERQREGRNTQLALAGRSLARAATTCKSVRAVVQRNEEELFRRAAEVDFMGRSDGYARWKEYARAYVDTGVIARDEHRGVVFLAWANAPLPFPTDGGDSAKAAYIAQAQGESFVHGIDRAVRRIEAAAHSGRGPASFSTEGSKLLRSGVLLAGHEFRNLPEILAAATEAEPDRTTPQRGFVTRSFRLGFAYKLGRAIEYMRVFMQESAVCREPAAGATRANKFLLNGLFLIDAALTPHRPAEYSPYTLFPWLESIVPPDAHSAPRNAALVRDLMRRFHEAKTARQTGPRTAQNASSSSPSNFMETGYGLPLVQDACLMYILRFVGFHCAMTNTPGCVYLRVETDDGVLFAEASVNTLSGRDEIAAALNANPFTAQATPDPMLRQLEGARDFEMLLRTGRNLFHFMSHATRGVTDLRRRSLHSTLILKMMDVVAESAKALGMGGAAAAALDSVDIDRVIWSVFVNGASRVLLP